MNYKVDFKTKTMEWKSKYNKLIDDLDLPIIKGHKLYRHVLTMTNYPTVTKTKILSDGTIDITTWTPNYAQKAVMFISRSKTPITHLMQIARIELIRMTVGLATTTYDNATVHEGNYITFEEKSSDSYIALCSFHLGENEFTDVVTEI